MALIYTLAATFVVSLGGLLGVLSFWIKENQMKKWLKGLVSLSAGAMMGVTFLDLLPEATEMMDADVVFPLLLVFFIGFFFVEKVLHWRHCHKEVCEVHSFGYMNLIGDAIHNFVDGLLIAATFQVDIGLGLVTSIAVAFHEIPQEISDFGVLLYAGFGRRRALMANFGVALTAVLGGLVGSVATEHLGVIEPYLVTLAAASFLYVSASDLIPELRKVSSGSQLVSGFMLFLTGIALIWGLQQVVGHGHGHEDEGELNTVAVENKRGNEEFGRVVE